MRRGLGAGSRFESRYLKINVDLKAQMLEQTAQQAARRLVRPGAEKRCVIF
jgi:hypothetical protein